MEIEAFLLCDCATDQGGKLNILGAFDGIYAKELPVTHPACSIAARIRFEHIEAGDHAARLNIIDQDGNAVGPKLQGTISVRPRAAADSVVVNLILNIQRLKFEKFGRYRIDLAVDGRLAASLSFAVKELPPRQAE